MESRPKNKPFGVVTQAGRSYIADVKSNGSIAYRGNWTPKHATRKAVEDPPIFWWYGPLPILPSDIDRIFARFKRA